MTRLTLLTIDAAINLGLGLVLILFPGKLSGWLGLPSPGTLFYSSILGAVLTGIGLALLLEHFRGTTGVNGLGLGGAVSINICGSAMLVGWLVGRNSGMSTRGQVVLWMVALVVLGLSVVELLSQMTGRGRQETPLGQSTERSG